MRAEPRHVEALGVELGDQRAGLLAGERDGRWEYNEGDGWKTDFDLIYIRVS